MNLRFSRPIRIISVIVLFSFLWTFGGLCEIAYAVKNSDELRVESFESKNKQGRCRVRQGSWGMNILQDGDFEA